MTLSEIYVNEQEVAGEYIAQALHFLLITIFDPFIHF